MKRRIMAITYSERKTAYNDFPHLIIAKIKSDANYDVEWLTTLFDLRDFPDQLNDFHRLFNKQVKVGDFINTDGHHDYRNQYKITPYENTNPREVLYGGSGNVDC